MTEEKSIFSLTDKRISFLLGSGDALYQSIDPERILDGAVPVRIDHSSMDKDGNVSWRLWVEINREKNVTVHIRGNWSPGGGMSVCGIDVTTDDGRTVRHGTSPSKTVLKALGKADRIPVHLRRYLSPTGPAKPLAKGFEGVFGELFFGLEKSALFWGVEGVGQHSPLRQKFNGFTIIYEREGGQMTNKAHLRCFAKTDEGKISITSELGLYGLSEKKVYLERNLGMDHEFRADCYIKRKKKNLPSVLVAYELDERLPIFFSSEQTARLQKGEKKAAKTTAAKNG